MAHSDAELIKRTLDGDETAFGFLMDKYKRAVHALAYRKIGDFHIAEEITQDTFLKAYQKLGTLRDPAHFPGWLYVIAARCCISWHRRNRVPMQSLDSLDAEQMDAFAWAKYADARAREEVRDALESLPESDRTILTLHYLGGLTCEEIGRFIGTSRGAVKDRLYRARCRLKEEMIEMMQETLGVFQLPPTLTQQVMERIRHLKPTTTPSSKPLVPWIAATTLAVMALLVGLGFMQSMRFQTPYSLSDTESEFMVELTEAQILETPLPKQTIANHVRASSAGDFGIGNGLNSSVLALAAGAQQEEKSDQRGSISGRVIYKESGKPAPNLPIRAVGMEPGMMEQHTHTGVDGTYMLKDLIVGPYAVMIGDTWEWHRTFDWRAPAHLGIRVKPNEVYTGVDFLLTPGAFVEGRVTDGDTGAQVEGIQIQVYDATHPPSQGMGHWTDTGVDGRYRFRVAGGALSISVHPHNTDYYVKAYQEQHRELHIAEGELLSGNDFVCYRGVSMSGIVQTEDGKPVAGAIVRTPVMSEVLAYAQTSE